MIKLYSYMFRALYDWLCDNDFKSRIVVDATKPGVVVPQAFVHNGTIVLSIYYQFIGDLEIKADYISFKARFQGKVEEVVVPYYAITELMCIEANISIPLNMWLISLDLACRHSALEDGSDLELLDDKSLMQRIETELKNVENNELSAVQRNNMKVDFTVTEIESDEINNTESQKSAQTSESDSDSQQKENSAKKNKPDFSFVE